MSPLLPLSPLALPSSPLEAELERLLLEDERAPKKFRMDEESRNETLTLSGISLGKDLIQKILSYLPFRELLTFEGVSSPCQQYTERRWKELVVEERLDFDWAKRTRATDSAKYRYILGKALLQYAEDISKVREERDITPEAAKERYQGIYNRFEGLMVRFPAFGTFLWNDLSQRSNKPLISQFQKIFLQPEFKGPYETGGELLLRGLSQVRVLIALGHQALPLIQIAENFQTLTRAIQKNATCASFLVVKLYPNVTDDVCVNLSISSIGKNNDCRGLDQLLSIRPTLIHRLLERKSLFPPVLTALGMDDEYPIEDREHFLACAIRGYEDHVPVKTLVAAAEVKLELEKWNDAAMLYTKAITAYGDHVPPEVLNGAGVAYLSLQQWEKGAEVCTKAITAYGDHIPREVLFNAGLAYLSLKQWEKSAEIYTKAITAYGDHITPEILGNAGAAFFELKQWDKAVEYFAAAITAYGDEIPPLETLAYAAYAYYHLEQWEKAEEIFTKFFTALKDNIPSGYLHDAAIVNCCLEKWEKAAELFTNFFTFWEDNVTPSTLKYAANAYLQVEQWEKAVEFYAKAITAYGDHVPPEVLEDAALAKSKLETISST